MDDRTGRRDRTAAIGPDRMTRREFMRLTLTALAGAVASSACGLAAERPTPREPVPGLIPTPLPYAEQYPGVPLPPEVLGEPGNWLFFTEHQAATVEALTARLLPGTPDDPGAREAGVVRYIDHVLALENGYDQPVYLDEPLVELYEGDEPPEDAEHGDSPDVIWVSAEEIGRYGYQSPLTPVEVYRIGLEALDEYAQEEYSADYVDLEEDEQDEILEAMVGEEDMGFEPFTAKQFFHVLRRHTNEGMFSDPAYGGNRDKVGWRLIGYPGAQRAYTPTEVQREGIAFEREPWGLADLPHFHYSRPLPGGVPGAARRGEDPGWPPPRQEQTPGRPGHSHQEASDRRHGG